MKRFASILAILLAVSTLFADTTTSRLGLTKPDQSSTGWGTKVNANYDIIDAAAASLTGTNTFSGINIFTSRNPGFQYGFQVGYIAPIVGCDAITGSASCNTAIGNSALQGLRPTGYIGRTNIAIGNNSLGNFVDGGNTSQSGGNTAVGNGALNSSTQTANTALGDFAGAYLITGNRNVYLGYDSGVGAGGNTTTFNGDSQIYIGAFTGPDRGSSTYLTNAVAIGEGAVINSSSAVSLGCMDVNVNPNHVTCVDNSTSFNVGIATDTPRERLHLVGNLRVDSGFVQVSSKTLTQLKAITPTAVGQMYFCSNCTTDAIVVSTGTTIGGFGRVSARTTTIQ